MGFRREEWRYPLGLHGVQEAGKHAILAVLAILNRRDVRRGKTALG